MIETIILYGMYSDPELYARLGSDFQKTSQPPRQKRKLPRGESEAPEKEELTFLRLRWTSSADSIAKSFVFCQSRN